MLSETLSDTPIHINIPMRALELLSLNVYDRLIAFITLVAVQCLSQVQAAYLLFSDRDIKFQSTLSPGSFD